MAESKVEDILGLNEFQMVQEKANRAIALLTNPPPIEVGMSNYEVLLEEGKMKLLRYKPIVPNPHSMPILVVYALVNKPYILDLQPDRSVVQTLLKGGFDVYLIDWGTPTPSDKYLTLHDYVDGYMQDCVDVVRERHDTDSVSILGYCMGGTLSVMFSGIHPEKVRNLILMAPPLDLESDDGLLHIWSRKEYLNVDKLVDTVGNIPGDFLNFSYMLLNPVNNLYTKYFKLIEKIDNEAFVEMFLRMEKWSSDGIPLAGEAFREFIKKCYQENQLLQNEMYIGGKKVELDNIKMPVLNIIGEYDHLVPPAASSPFTNKIPSVDKETIIFPTGHIGLSVSSAAHARLWPMVIEWIKDRCPECNYEITSLQFVKGIGPKTREKLEAMGIMTVEDLVGADNSKVAEKTGTSAIKVKEWVAAAEKLVKRGV